MTIEDFRIRVLVKLHLYLSYTYIDDLSEKVKAENIRAFIAEVEQAEVTP